jgi:protein SCO1
LALTASCSKSSDALSGVSIDPKPDVSSIKGSAVSFVPKKGNISLVYFGYTHCPDVCPTTLAAVKRSLNGLGNQSAKRIQVSMVTVDPERDRKSLLQEYLTFFWAGWTPVVLDDAAELRSVADAFGAQYSVTKKGAEVEVSHSGSLYAVDDSGHLVVQWPFDASPDFDTIITHDLKILFSSR